MRFLCWLFSLEEQEEFSSRYIHPSFSQQHDLWPWWSSTAGWSVLPHLELPSHEPLRRCRAKAFWELCVCLWSLKQQKCERVGRWNKLFPSQLTGKPWALKFAYHRMVCPVESSPCAQSCSSLFRARTACFPTILRRLYVDCALSWFLKHTHDLSSYLTSVWCNENHTTIPPKTRLDCRNL